MEPLVLSAPWSDAFILRRPADRHRQLPLGRVDDPIQTADTILQIMPLALSADTCSNLDSSTRKGELPHVILCTGTHN